MLVITPVAAQHFAQLLAPEPDNMQLRLFVAHPGTPDADVGISFCVTGDEEPHDLQLQQAGFTMFIDGAALQFLQDATVDFVANSTGGEVIIKAPHIKGMAPQATASLSEKVQHLLDTEIAPYLASHGGKVALVDVTDLNEVLLSLGGGCQGCGMASITLQQHITKTLQQKLPEITAVKDVTDHDKGTTPYC